MDARMVVRVRDGQHDSLGQLWRVGQQLPSRERFGGTTLGRPRLSDGRPPSCTMWSFSLNKPYNSGRE